MTSHHDPLVLIAHADTDACAAMVRGVRTGGHQAVGVDTFEAAKRQINLQRVDVLIAAAHMGAFHGLHLVHLARGRHPGVVAIVLSDKDDAVLQAELEELGALLLVVPTDREALAESISSVMTQYRAGV
jgi:DNA-binding response OmpR family regulator